jgi:hypothetical protein
MDIAKIEALASSGRSFHAHGARTGRKKAQAIETSPAEGQARGISIREAWRLRGQAQMRGIEAEARGGVPDRDKKGIFRNLRLPGARRAVPCHRGENRRKGARQPRQARRGDVGHAKSNGRAS